MLSKHLHNPRFLCFSTSYSSTSIFDGGTHRRQHQSEEQRPYKMKSTEWLKHKKKLTTLTVDPNFRCLKMRGSFFCQSCGVFFFKSTISKVSITTLKYLSLLFSHFESMFHLHHNSKKGGKTTKKTPPPLFSQPKKDNPP